MAKFIYIQDVHFKGVNPSSRQGNYYEDILKKLDEILELSQKLNVDFIIDGGDFFDSSLISNLMLDEILDKIENNKIKWYMLYGNHCMIGHYIQNSKSTSLAHMFRRSKLVSHLDTIVSKNYFIKGIEYFHNIEQYIKDKGLQSLSKNAEFKVAIVHALIMLKPLPYQAMHVVAKDIKTNYDIILVAHNHKGWGIKEINGTKFVNIGCLGRRKIDEAEIKPSVLYIDTNTKELKIIELKSAKSKQEIFKLNEIEQSKEFNKDIQNFIDSLKDTEISGLDLRGTLEEIGKKKKIPRDVLDCIIERIGKYELSK